MKEANWLKWAGLITFAYLISVGWVIGPIKAWSFVTTDKLNEIGDFLAGVFSPLAFIWLVAAVLTQRQELDETRDQFAQNQEVVDAQMATISSQNELLAQQHIQAERSAQQTYKLNLFDKRFEIFNELLAVRKSMEKRTVVLDEWQQLEALAKRASFVFPESVSQYLEGVAEKALELITFHTDNRAFFQINYRDARKPLDPEKSEIQKQYTADKLQLESMLSLESLNALMAASMRVTDEQSPT